MDAAWQPRLKPEAAYTQAGTRNVFVVADLNEAQMTEAMNYVEVNKRVSAVHTLHSAVASAELPQK